MSILNRLRQGVNRHTAPNETQSTSTAHDTEIQTVTETMTAGKDAEAGVFPDGGPPEKNPDDLAPTRDAQLGVQKAEAVTLVWTKKWLAGLLLKYDLPSFVCTYGTQCCMPF